MGVNVVKLEDIANVDYGTRVVKSKVEGDEYPVYGGGGETFRINKYNRENCVVVSRFAMSPKCTRYVNEKIFLNDSGLTVSTKDNSLLLQEYLDWYLLSKNDEIYSLGRGAGQRNLEIPSFKRMLISYPTDLEEQRKIISQLKLADEIRAKKKLANDKLDEFLKSTFISMFGDPIKNEKGWATKSLSSVAPIKSYSGDVENFDGKYWLLNLDVVESNTGKILEYNYEASIPNSTCCFNSDMVLYSKLRPYLNKVVLPNKTGYATSELVPLNPVKEKLNKYFLASLLRSKYFVDDINVRVAGAKMPRVSMDYLRNFPIILPPIEDQNKFAQIVEKVEAQKQKNELVIEQMNNLFNSLSQKAFKGELQKTKKV